MPAPAATPTRSAAPLHVAFAGGPGAPAGALRLEVPWLAGAAVEDIFREATPVPAEAGARLFRSGSFLLGHVREAFVPAELAARSEGLYRRILAATAGAHLCRVWNYVPRINATTAGLEHYQAFCLGRSLAFERALGGQFRPRLPAASAVGSAGDHLDAIFVASTAVPRHFENPAQVPAYDYPPEHGPRSPSFARATVVREGGATWTFVSGTAAIKGHRTVAPDALAAQLDCTLDNLRLIAREAGLGAELGADGNVRRHFKVYLRRPADLAATRARLDRELFRARDTVTYLHADICRAELAVEIEATIVAE